MDTLGIQGSGKNSKIPQPLITKVTIDQKSENTNPVFTLDFMFQGTLKKPKRNSSRLRGKNRSFNDKIKFAIIKFEISENSNAEMTPNFIRDLVNTRFLPLARNLILDVKPAITLPPEIKIFSLKDLYDLYDASYQTLGRDGIMGYRISATDIQFEATSKNPTHISFCVLPYIDLEAEVTISNPTATNNIFHYQQMGISNHKRRLNKQGNGQLLNLYKFDYVVAMNRSKVIENGYLFERRDNKNIWTGPLRALPNGNYVTGRIANDLALVVGDRNVDLRKIYIPYSKIQDLRNISKTSKSAINLWKNMFEIHQTKDVITEIQKRTGNAVNTFDPQKPDLPNKFIHDFSTLDKNYNYNTMFMVNMPNLLLTKTRFPAILQSVIGDKSTIATRILKGIMNSTDIKHCEIFRRRVREESIGAPGLTFGNMVLPDENAVVLNTDPERSNSPESPIPILSFSPDSQSSTIEKLNFSFQKNNKDFKMLRAFTFKENFLNKADAKYQYKAKLLVDDGVYRYVRAQATLFSQRYKLFIEQSKKVLDFLPQFWDRKGKYFLLNAIEAKYGANFIIIFTKKVLAPLMDSLEIVLRILAAGPIDHTRLKNAFVKATSFVTSDPTSFLAVTNTLEDLMSKIFLISGLDGLELREINVSQGLDRIFPSVIYNHGCSCTSALENTFVYEEDFETLLCNREMAGYEYGVVRNNDSQGIKELSESEFVTRYVGEMSKYFDPQRLNQTTTKKGPALNIQNNKTRFFTPVSYKLSSIDKLLPDTLNQISRDEAKQSLLNILFYKQNSRVTNFGVEKYDNLLSRLTGFNIEENEIVSRTTPPRARKKAAEPGCGIKRDEGDFVSRTGIDEEKNWRTALTEQKVDLDNVVTTRTYQDSLVQNSSGANITITNLILSSKILINKTSLGRTYDQTTDFLKNKISNSETPNQTINSILSLVGFQVLQSSKQGAKNSNAIIEALTEYDIPVKALNVKLLDDYGLWWFNYDNIVELLYCDSYSLASGFSWKPLTFNVYQSQMKTGNTLFCKFIKKTDKALNQIDNKFLDLPIFNKYFIINPDNPTPTAMTKTNTDTPNYNFGKNLYKMAALTKKYSSDFYQFVKPDLVSILGKPDNKRAVALLKNTRANIIKTITSRNRIEEATAKG